MAVYTLSLVVVGLLSVVCVVDLFGPKVGPYDLEIEKFADCKDQGSRKIIVGTKITKVGRGKYLYNENFSFLVPVDDDFQEHIELQKWGNGGWRPKYMEGKLKNCDEIFNVLKDAYKSLMRSAGVNLEKCPMPMGPYNIEIEKFADCKDQGSRKIIVGTKITKVGRGKYLYNENFSFLVPVDDDFKEIIEIQKWGNGGWIQKYMEVKLKNCDEIFNVLKDMYKSLMRSAGVNLEKCPMPMGNYTAKDVIIELNVEKTIPVMEYGKYRALMNLIYKDEKVGCVMIYGEVIPKSLG
ncbi:uncharacterized protein LOC129000538 [Macrosteles quadrilineatus]|uniref:uncharacterized protein LOC129000538 n=1 Tax=Macrosteles quadrilineatus TaxID=74068 RepID=UPI0023E0ADE4|nr:uncharacterized protein LOC129000538 [Macrosteles quadrilineatus]